MTSHSFTLRFSDTDLSRHLSLPALERYLLEAAGESANLLGIGTDHMLQHYGSAWVLTRLSVELTALPTYLQNLEIDTWVVANAHMLSFRDYRLFLRQGNQRLPIGRCASQWTLLNLSTRQVDLTAFRDPAWEAVTMEEGCGLSRAPRLGLLDAPDGERLHRVAFSDLDYNGHCNSCQYPSFMLDACHDLAGKAPVRMDINYVREAHLDEELRVQWVKRTSDDGCALQFALLTPSGDLSCSALLSYATAQ